MAKNNNRILIAKPDSDGHDYGTKVVALGLRNAGMEVIYSDRKKEKDKRASAGHKEMKW